MSPLDDDPQYRVLRTLRHRLCDMVALVDAQIAVLRAGEAIRVTQETLPPEPPESPHSAPEWHIVDPLLDFGNVFNTADLFRLMVSLGYKTRTQQTRLLVQLLHRDPLAPGARAITGIEREKCVNWLAAEWQARMLQPSNS